MKLKTPLFKKPYIELENEQEKELLKLDKAQEIKRLKEEYVILQNASDEVEEEKDREINRLNKLKERYQLEKEVFKGRIDKAIEYIEERKNLNWYADGVFVYELLNILQGVDKE